MGNCLSVLLLAGVLTGEASDFRHYESYTEAYRVAQRARVPMLVILNPPADSEKPPVTLEELLRTEKRRKLLEGFIVVLIDTSTEHGRKVHALFDSKPLPRVVIIDENQRYQIFKTSEPIDSSGWDRILQRYRNGSGTAGLTLGDQFCPT